MRTSQQAKFATANTYSQEDIDTLLYMIEEEKMAGDLYDSFYAQTGLKVFKTIAKSEDRHMKALLSQADKLGLDTDAILGQPAGEFTNADLQALFDSLLLEGSTSADAALEAGLAVESADIADLEAASVTLAGTRLAKVYDSLLDGSAQHYDAFEYYLSL